MTVVILVWNKDLLLAFGASENTISYANSYMSLYAFGTLFVQLTLGMNAFITAQGFAKTGMFTVMIGAVANIILDPVLSHFILYRAAASAYPKNPEYRQPFSAGTPGFVYPHGAVSA